MYNFDYADEEEAERRVIGISALLQALIPNLCSVGVLELWQGSVTVPHKLQPLGK